MTKRERKTLFSLAPQPQRLRRQAFKGFFSLPRRFCENGSQCKFLYAKRSEVSYKQQTAEHRKSLQNGAFGFMAFFRIKCTCAPLQIRHKPYLVAHF